MLTSYAISSCVVFTLFLRLWRAVVLSIFELVTQSALFFGIFENSLVRLLLNYFLAFYVFCIASLLSLFDFFMNLLISILVY